MAKKPNPIDFPTGIEFNEQGMRNFESVNDAVAYFSKKENGGYKKEKSTRLFNSTFSIVVGNRSFNLSFEKWKVKFDVVKKVVEAQAKTIEPIVSSTETTNVG